MKILKAAKTFMKKLITKIISVFKKKEESSIKKTIKDNIKHSIHEKYVIMNGKRFLGYVTSKQKLFGILSYDFSTNPKRQVSFTTKEEAFKFMVDEYRSCFNKMWNIDSMFRYPINGYNQAQVMQLIRYYVKQLNNSKIGTILVCNFDVIPLTSRNRMNMDFDGDTLDVCTIKERRIIDDI